MDREYKTCISKNRSGIKCGNLALKDRVICQLHTELNGYQIYGKVEEIIENKVYFFYTDKDGDIIMN